MTPPQPPYGHQPGYPPQQPGYPHTPPQAYQQFQQRSKRRSAIALGIAVCGLALIHALASVMNNYSEFNTAPVLPIIGSYALEIGFGVHDPDIALPIYYTIAVLTIASGVAMSLRQGWARFVAAFGGLLLSLSAIMDALVLGDPVFFVAPLLLTLVFIGVVVVSFVPPIGREFARTPRSIAAQPPAVWGHPTNYPQQYPQRPTNHPRR